MCCLCRALKALKKQSTRVMQWRHGLVQWQTHGTHANFESFCIVLYSAQGSLMLAVRMEATQSKVLHRPCQW